jgi:hypothetical protein
MGDSSMIKVFNIADALQSLTPNASWRYEDENYGSLEWYSEDIAKPSLKEVNLEIDRLTAEQEQKQIELAALDAAQQAAKDSALLKLQRIGLTEEEAKAIVGV